MCKWQVVRRLNFLEILRSRPAREKYVRNSDTGSVSGDLRSADARDALTQSESARAPASASGRDDAELDRLFDSFPSFLSSPSFSISS